MESGEAGGEGFGVEEGGVPPHHHQEPLPALPARGAGVVRGCGARPLCAELPASGGASWASMDAAALTTVFNRQLRQRLAALVHQPVGSSLVTAVIARTTVLQVTKVEDMIARMVTNNFVTCCRLCAARGGAGCPHGQSADSRSQLSSSQPSSSQLSSSQPSSSQLSSSQLTSSQLSSSQLSSSYRDVSNDGIFGILQCKMPKMPSFESSLNTKTSAHCCFVQASN